MEYKTISEVNPTNFDSKVNDLILKGWEPLGGIAIAILRSHDEVNIVFAQAMIKHK